MSDWTKPTKQIDRFGDAMSLLCGGNRPSDEMMSEWLSENNDNLQGFACEFGPPWAQGIVVIDAARMLAEQPVEGVKDEADRGRSE